MIIALLFSLFTVFLSRFYFNRVRLSRPKIGTYNLSDIIVMVIGIILIPYLYLALPNIAIVIFFFIGDIFLLRTFLTPALKNRPALWASLFFLGLDYAILRHFGPQSLTYLLTNDILLICGVTIITNLWAQNGMKAKHVSILAGFLTFYDYFATSAQPVTKNLMFKLASLPFIPSLMGWREGSGIAGLGIGDLLFSTLFPLIMYKAFGKAAANIAIILEFAVLVIMNFFLVHLAPSGGLFPTMLVMGPLMVLQFLYWYHKNRWHERTMKEFRHV